VYLTDALDCVIYVGANMDFSTKAAIEVILSVCLVISPISGEVSKVLPCFQFGAAIFTSVNQGIQIVDRFKNKK
jgi:hypothetical protein